MGGEVGFVYKYKKSKNLSLAINCCLTVSLWVWAGLEALSRPSPTTAKRDCSLGRFPQCVHMFPNLFFSATPLPCTQFSMMAEYLEVWSMVLKLCKLLLPSNGSSTLGLCVHQSLLLPINSDIHQSLTTELGKSSPELGRGCWPHFCPPDRLKTFRGGEPTPLILKGTGLGSWQKHKSLLLIIKPPELTGPRCCLNEAHSLVPSCPCPLQWTELRITNHHLKGRAVWRRVTNLPQCYSLLIPALRKQTGRHRSLRPA